LNLGVTEGVLAPDRVDWRMITLAMSPSTMLARGGLGYGQLLCGFSHDLGLKAERCAEEGD